MLLACRNIYQVRYKISSVDMLVDNVDYHPEKELFSEGNARGKLFLRGMFIWTVYYYPFRPEGYEIVRAYLK